MTRYLIVSLNFGAELAPTIDTLRVAFPDITFESENSAFHTGTSNWAIYAVVQPGKVDEVRSLAIAVRDAFSKGYSMGFDDRGKL